MSFENILEVEESLSQADIFYNGFTGRRNCHPDSYGTCVDYTKLAEWCAATKFSRERLEECVHYWTINENMQPPLLQVAFQIQRHFKLTGAQV